MKCKDHFVSGEEFHIKSCQSCGFRITEDAEDEAGIGRYYQSEEYISHSNTTKGLVNNIYHKVRSFMLRRKSSHVIHFSSVEQGEILDIGCGTGYFLNEMQTKGWKVTGIEKDDKAREFASSEFNIKCFGPEQLNKLSEGKYNVISLWHVLEHIHNLNEHMQRFKELLAGDGTLVLALPNFLSYDARHYKEYWAAYDLPRHLWHFSPDQIIRLAEKHGFSLKGIKRMPFDSFYISLMSEKYKQNKLALFSGFLQGKISFLNSLIRKRECSSLIYVFGV